MVPMRKLQCLHIASLNHLGYCHMVLGCRALRMYILRGQPVSQSVKDLPEQILSLIHI